MHEVASARVAVSRYDAVAVAGTREFTGYVAVRYPEGRWTAVHRLGGGGTLADSPDVAFDARGRLLLVWSQARRVGNRGFAYAGPNQAMTQTWTEGKGWGPVQLLGPSKSFALGQPRLAVDGRGDAIAYWRGYRRSHGRSVEALSSSFRTADRGWGPMQQASGGGPYRDVRLDAQGNAYAVWATYAARDYFAFRSRRRAGWGAARALPGKPASAPKIAVTPNGTAVIGWRAAGVDSEGEGLQLGPPRAIVRAPNGTWSPVRALSGTPTHEVLLAVSPTTGRVLLTWAPPRQPVPTPGADEIRFSLFSPPASFAPERRVAGVTSGPIAYRANGDAIAVFASGPFIASVVRFSALVPREPSFSEPVTIVSGAARPSLATPSGGVGPVEAAMVFYFEPKRRLYLSLLTRAPHEPRR